MVWKFGVGWFHEDFNLIDLSRGSWYRQLSAKVGLKFFLETSFRDMLCSCELSANKKNEGTFLEAADKRYMVGLVGILMSAHNPLCMPQCKWISVKHSFAGTAAEHSCRKLIWGGGGILVTQMLYWLTSFQDHGEIFELLMTYIVILPSIPVVYFAHQS